MPRSSRARSSTSPAVRAHEAATAPSELMPEPPRYDFVTLGETLLRLSPPGMQRLEQGRVFEVGIGGSELNVACLLARLGRRAAWVSRLPEGPLGRIVDGEGRRHGVDMSLCKWVEARQGLMFFEAGPVPRNARVIYDRKNSAAAGMTLADADWPSLVAVSARVHLSGITPALSETCRALVLEVAQVAGRAGKKLSYEPVSKLSRVQLRSGSRGLAVRVLTASLQFMAVLVE